jgi:arylsulfatase A-like enzyme
MVRQRRLTPPLLGLLIGTFCGVVDWLLLAKGWASSGTFSTYLPPLTRLVVVLTWTWAGYAGGLVAQWLGWDRLRTIPIVVAAPGLLLLSRAYPPMRMTGLSRSSVLLALLAALIVLSIPISLIPLGRSRRPFLNLGIGIAGGAALLFLAADRPVIDRLPVKADRPASEGGRNVVLIFIDTIRYDDATGPSMPRLQDFAKRAVSFDSAWAPAPWTVPSHLAVLTGADPWTITFMESAPPETPPTLAERFRARGYSTAAVFANPLLSRGMGFQRGFNQYTRSIDSGVCRSGFGYLLNRMWFHGGPRTPICGWFVASEVTSRAVHFIRRAQRPYFLAVNYIDPHEPYYVPRSCRPPSFRPATTQEREVLLTSTAHSPAPPDVAGRVHANYRVALQCLDRSLGELLDEVTRDPETIVAVVGDHGEQFGEHGLGSHGNSLFAQLVHVPLLLKTPGVAERRIDAPASISDLYASLAISADPARAAASPLPLLDDRLRRPVISQYQLLTTTWNPKSDGAFSIVLGDDQLIRWHDGRDALYDYRADPQEGMPLSIAENFNAVQQMRAVLIRTALHQKRFLDFNALGYMR